MRTARRRPLIANDASLIVAANPLQTQRLGKKQPTRRHTPCESRPPLIGGVHARIITSREIAARRARHRTVPHQRNPTARKVSMYQQPSKTPLPCSRSHNVRTRRRRDGCDVLRSAAATTTTGKAGKAGKAVTTGKTAAPVIGNQRDMHESTAGC